MNEQLEKLSKEELINQVKLQGSVLAKQSVRIGQLSTQQIQTEVVSEVREQEIHHLMKENERLVGVISELKEKECDCDEEEVPESYHDI